VNYAPAIKKACDNKCLIAGYSPWGWCGYFEDGADHDAGFCESGGPDYIAAGNIPLAQYYLQEMAAYDAANNQRILDIFDFHYYPAADGVTFSCDESDATTNMNRLQAPRGLYDWSFTDGSWIKEPTAVIPRFRAMIDKYYPGTQLSISEYNFGGDTCITSTIAHSEALAIFATYGLSVGTRWSKPAPGSMVTNGFNILTNYDGKGGNILKSSSSGGTAAYNVKDSDVATVSSYMFMAGDASMMYVVLYNKDQSASNSVMVTLENNKNNVILNKQMIDVYGVDKNNGLSRVGQVTPNNGYSFNVTMPAWTIRLAVITL
jgi:hypothetical protein